jgi:hypothetical protein
VRGTWVGLDCGTCVALGVVVEVGVGVAVLSPLNPPHTIISLPVQTPVGTYRAMGALLVLVPIQASAPGLYLPPVLKIRGVPSTPDNHRAQNAPTNTPSSPVRFLVSVFKLVLQCIDVH